jgi:probable rRNA maturation factor
MTDTDFPLEVELNFQAPFFVDDKAPDASDNSVGPIAEEVWQQWFEVWLDHLQLNESPINSYELSLRLTNDSEIQALNASYRQKDQPTDVLAFAALEAGSPQPEEMLAEIPLYLGDIVISIETAQRQANERSHSLQHELIWLTTHGLLHLLGWDHPDEASFQSMVKQQEALLQTIGFKIQYDDANDEC